MLIYEEILDMRRQRENDVQKFSKFCLIYNAVNMAAILKNIGNLILC